MEKAGLPRGLQDEVLNMMYHFLIDNNLMESAMALKKEHRWESAEATVSRPVPSLLERLGLSTPAHDIEADFSFSIMDSPALSEQSNAAEAGVVKSWKRLHQGKPVLCTAVMAVEDETPLVLSGGADRTLRCHRLLDNEQTEEMWSCGPFKGAVLSCAVLGRAAEEGAAGGGDDALAVLGTMDGTVALVKCADGSIQQQWQAHKKFAHRVVWGRGGSAFASAGHDRSVCVFRREGENEEWSMERVELGSIPESVAFAQNDDMLLAAVRDSCCLLQLDVGNLEAAPKELNMNALGDKHVSFQAMDLEVSESGAYVLIGTDQARTLLLRLSDATVVRAFWGDKFDGFGTCRVAFGRKEAFVYATSVMGHIDVYSVSNGAREAKLQTPHKKGIRDLALRIEGDKFVMVTSSLDGSLAAWQP